MKIISGTTDLHTDEETAVVIGKFDGMHRGHQYLILELMSAGALPPHGRKTVVFTFDPSPASFFSGEMQPELFTRDEKRRVFEKLGVDVLVEYPMNEETAKTPPEVFVREVLSGMLKARLIVAGKDLSFGYRGKGDVALLQSLAKECGYETRLVDKLQYEGRDISSTYVREAVAAGDMELATTLLGAPYTVSGHVLHGKRLGTTIGHPTVNLTPPAEKLLPPDGVYFTTTLIGDEAYEGMTNVGLRPTVEAHATARSVETNLFDYEGDLYDREIAVSFCRYHRQEERFADVDTLIAQLQKDREAAAAFFRQVTGKRTGSLMLYIGSKQ